MEQKSPEKNTEEAKEESRILVSAVQLQTGDLKARLEINARVSAFERADVAPKLEGVVIRVHKQEGDNVQVGDLLAEIENEQDRLARDAKLIAVQQAELAVSQSNLNLRETRALLRIKESSLANDEQKLARAQDEHKEGVISDEDLEAAVYARDVSLGEKKQTDLAVERIEEELKVKQLGVNEAKNSLAQAELRCKWAGIRATIAGRITKRHIKLGQKSTPGQPAFSIVDMNSLVVEPTVPEREYTALKVGQAAQFVATSNPTIRFPGVVEFVGSEVDAGKGSIPIRIHIEEVEDKLLPGMFVTGHIVTELRPKVLLLPKKSLLFDRDRVYVFAVKKEADKTRAQKIYIERGLQDATQVEYLPLAGQEAQLGPDSWIVAVGLDRLTDGALIELDGAGAESPAEGEGAQMAGKKKAESESK